MTLDIKFYLALFLRRLHYFLLIAIAVSAVGLTMATILPPVYVAQARLLVESEQIPDQLAASTVQTGAAEQIQIIQQRLMTRANLLDIANRLQVYDQRTDMDASQVVEDMRARTEIAVVAKRGQATVVTISFEAAKAPLAAEVANEIVTLVLQEDVSLRTGAASQTLDFFKQELTRLDAELARQSARILEFKQQHAGALPDSLEFNRSQQLALQERLVEFDRQEAALKDRRARLVQVYETTGQIEAPAAAATPEQKQLQALKSELERTLIVLSPQNPKVKVLQAQIASLEAVVTAQMAAAGAPAGASLASPYEMQLAEIDAELVAIAPQRDRASEELAKVRIALEATPANEIALGTLEREFANIRGQYDQVTQRLSVAETGERIEALSKGQRISVIEQATTPGSPVSPNRPAIAAGSVGAGLALGFGVVVLLELMNRSIRRPKELTSKLGITAFATLPYVHTRGEVRRRRGLIISAFAIVLLGIPAGLFALHTYYLPMDLLISQAIERLGLAPLIESLRQGLAQ